MGDLIKFKKREKGFRASSKGKKGELVFYGPVGASFWEDSITAKSVSSALKDMGEVDEIEIRINSVGGDVFEGVAIYNRLAQHKAKKVVYVDALAASIASIIAMAGDEILVGDGAEIMVHKPWTIAAGDSSDFLNVVDRLDDVEENLVTIYSKRTGLGRSEIKEMLAKETWLDADTAIEEGFATAKAELPDYQIAASMVKPDIEKASWINKAPKNFGEKAKKEINDKLTASKDKIESFLARK